MAAPPATTRVGLIGHGAIGSVVAAELVSGAVAGVELTAVLDDLAPHPDLEVQSIEELLGDVDLVVEAAGHGALAQYGPVVVDSGASLLIVSVGALADPELGASLVGRSPGRVMYTTGAIGGIRHTQGSGAGWWFGRSVDDFHQAGSETSSGTGWTILSRRR